MKDIIVKTYLGDFVVEDRGDVGYDIATNITDSNCVYQIPKGLTKSEIEMLFKEINELED